MHKSWITSELMVDAKKLWFFSSAIILWIMTWRKYRSIVECAMVFASLVNILWDNFVFGIRNGNEWLTSSAVVQGSFGRVKLLTNWACRDFSFINFTITLNVFTSRTSKLLKTSSSNQVNLLLMNETSCCLNCQSLWSNSFSYFRSVFKWLKRK